MMIGSWTSFPSRMEGVSQQVFWSSYSNLGAKGTEEEYSQRGRGRRKKKERKIIWERKVKEKRSGIHWVQRMCVLSQCVSNWAEGGTMIRSSFLFLVTLNTFSRSLLPCFWSFRASNSHSLTYFTLDSPSCKMRRERNVKEEKRERKKWERKKKNRGVNNLRWASGSSSSFFIFLSLSSILLSSSHSPSSFKSS